jgi:hypothetical protein
MTLREAIKLKLEYQFEKRTMTTYETGDANVFHYFEMEINGVILHLAPVDDKPTVWFGSIFDYNVKFYTPESFKSLIKSIQNGEWQED